MGAKEGGLVSSSDSGEEASQQEDAWLAGGAAATRGKQQCSGSRLCGPCARYETGCSELEAGQPYQSPLPPPAQQQQQQQQQQQYHWSAASILQQMGTGDPLGSIAQPYTAGLGMSLNTQQPFRGQEASVPIAGVASLFLELQSKLMEVKSTVDGLAAAGGSMRPGAQDASRDAAAVGPASAAPATGMPPGSWAAVGSRTVQAAAAGPGGDTAGPAAAPAGKGKKQQQKPLVRAFPSFGAMGSVKALAKYYFVDALPEKLTALDDVGAVNDDNLPWTPALADKAGLEKWRGGRQGLFQRWYAIRFVAAHVKEKVKQLISAAGAGELATVTEAAAAMDAERTEMKLSLNRYYHFLESGKGNSKGSSSGEDGGAAGGQRGE
ncbi:hypothetical protein OEZ86_012324 [Tetradesmus obliquus]|nr:hypothetical protein OEZ86_012324 [Tetradesmus obliquus]